MFQKFFCEGSFALSEGETGTENETGMTLDKNWVKLDWIYTSPGITEIEIRQDGTVMGRDGVKWARRGLRPPLYSTPDE